MARVNLQLDDDSTVAMKLMSSRTISSEELANQLAMFILLNSATVINLETTTHIGRSLSLERNALGLSVVLLTSSPFKARDEISLRG